QIDGADALADAGTVAAGRPRKPLVEIEQADLTADVKAPRFRFLRLLPAQRQHAAIEVPARIAPHEGQVPAQLRIEAAPGTDPPLAGDLRREGKRAALAGRLAYRGREVDGHAAQVAVDDDLQRPAVLRVRPRKVHRGEVRGGSVEQFRREADAEILGKPPLR